MSDCLLPNKRSDQNKQVWWEKKGHLAWYLLYKSIKEYSGVFRLCHKRLKGGKNSNKTAKSSCLFIKDFRLTQKYSLLLFNKTEKSVSPIGYAINDKSYRNLMTALRDQ